MQSNRWRRAGAFAADQFGVIAFAQLIECGFSAGAIQRAVRAGLLLPLHRGVFALGHGPTGQRGDFVASTFATGEASATSHLTGAEHLGILQAIAGVGRGHRSRRLPTSLAPGRRRAWALRADDPALLAEQELLLRAAS